MRRDVLEKFELASQKKQNHEYEPAICLYQEALALLGGSPQSEDHGVILNNLGSTYLTIGKLGDALKALMQAKVIKERLFPNKLTLANTYAYIGMCHRGLDNIDEAISYQRKALAIKETEAQNSPTLFDSYLEIASLLQLKGCMLHDKKEEGSIGYLKESLGFYEKALPMVSFRPQDGNECRERIYTSMSFLFAVIGKDYLNNLDEVNAFLASKKALETQESKKDQTVKSIALNTLGTLFHEKGNLLKAMEFHQKALEALPHGEETSSSRDFIYEQATKNIPASRIQERPNTTLVVISQNEEGVIRSNDQRYEGLMTYGLQTCFAVVISDKVKGIYVLQHHDSFTDPASIAEAITRENLSSPEVTLIYNGSNAWCNQQKLTAQEKIEGFLSKNNINYSNQPLRTDSVSNKNGGVVVTKNGEIDKSYFFARKKDQHQEERLVLARGYQSETEYTESQMLFEPRDLRNLELSDDIAKVTFTNESRKTFLKYDGKEITKNPPTLTPKMEDYVRRVQQEVPRSPQAYFLRIQKDRLSGVFDIRGDVWFERKPTFLDDFINILQNSEKILRAGCLAPPGSSIDENGITQINGPACARELTRRAASKKEYEAAMERMKNADQKPPQGSQQVHGR